MERLIPVSGNLLALLDGSTARWHLSSGDRGDPVGNEDQQGSAGCDAALCNLILALHRSNFDLWHEEDDARDPQATDAQIAGVKRRIDRLNQQRNDLVERIDATLNAMIDQVETSPLHSETPGMILDRLSIGTLKVYHTREESDRESATETHRERNRERLRVLLKQRADLADCLDTLMMQIGGGERRFKVYRQMKMYNDPELNPVLYRAGGG